MILFHSIRTRSLFRGNCLIYGVNRFLYGVHSVLSTSYANYNFRYCTLFIPTVCRATSYFDIPNFKNCFRWITVERGWRIHIISIRNSTRIRNFSIYLFWELNRRIGWEYRVCSRRLCGRRRWRRPCLTCQASDDRQAHQHLHGLGASTPHLMILSSSPRPRPLSLSLQPCQTYGVSSCPGHAVSTQIAPPLAQLARSSRLPDRLSLINRIKTLSLARERKRMLTSGLRWNTGMPNFGLNPPLGVRVFINTESPTLESLNIPVSLQS